MRLAALATAALLALSTAPASAALVTQTFLFHINDFVPAEPVYGQPPGPPSPPVTGQFTVTYDTATPSVYPGSSGVANFTNLSIDSINQDNIRFVYQMGDNLYVGTLGWITHENNDFADMLFVINDVSTNPTPVQFVYYNGVNTYAWFPNVGDIVFQQLHVPEPTTLSLLLVGMMGLGVASRFRRSSAAAVAA
ncbi:PEP-CTERM sorting domain-containing protein [Siccirubricoccus sp. G192]|uniref:PEP-CTERM sorting domain-containing protein n=1 Tax=Siccirubricoccus sp. G192 TaxID=2849651 RepID=UPI001C2CC13D|nr:PEP-CTERM sorting domain-containing protein [Siccirubricoccus sp. G192]MBV1797163.1 PEP-CTERM sorting domain-containing protein [Siccirubricoccus sp. G192]